MSMLTYASGYMNTVSMIRHIEKCRTCSSDRYIHSKAISDVRIVEYVALAVTGAFALYQFTTKFSSYSKTGFKSRVNSRTFDDVSLYTQYFLMGYNVLTFMMLTMIHTKCSNGGGCNMSALNKDYSRVKLVFGLFVACSFSYVAFHFQCPRDRFGVPQGSICKRILCENMIRSPREYSKFTERLSRYRKKYGSDESKMIRSIGLRDEAGQLIKGDEPGRFAEALSQIEGCVNARREETQTMGFRGSSWGERCSSTQFKDAMKRKKERSENRSDDRYRRRRRY